MGIEEEFRACRSVDIAKLTVKISIGEHREVVSNAPLITVKLLEYLESEKGIVLDDNARAAIAYALHKAYRLGYDDGYCDCEDAIDWEEFEEEW